LTEQLWTYASAVMQGQKERGENDPPPKSPWPSDEDDDDEDADDYDEEEEEEEEEVFADETDELAKARSEL